MGYAKDQFRKYAAALLATTALVAGMDGGYQMVQPENSQVKGSVVDVALNTKPWASNPEYIEKVRSSEEAYATKMAAITETGDNIQTITVLKLKDDYGRVGNDAAARKLLNEDAVKHISTYSNAMRVNAFNARMMLEKGMQELDMVFAEKTLPPVALAAFKAKQTLLGDSFGQQTFTAAEVRDFLIDSLKNAQERAVLTGMQKPNAKLFTITPQDYLDAVPSGLRQVMAQQPEVRKNIEQRIKPLV